MASNHTQTGLDALIMVKVFYNGFARRAKMPLRDTCVGVLEQKLRTFLQIPSDADILIERYSDSASSYVVLDQTNAAVYKQLYRAAKAKSKLKLRVSVKNQPQAQTQAQPETKTQPEAKVKAEPQPKAPAAHQATVSEEHEEAEKQTTVPAQVVDETPAQDSTAPSQATQTPSFHSDLTDRTSTGFSRAYDSTLLAQAAKLAQSADLRREFQSRLAGLGANMDDQYQLDLEAASSQPQAQGAAPTFQHDTDSAAPQEPYAICCNSCEKTTHDVHYHCSTCEDGDFDLCQDCVDLGITCHSSQHWLIKRTKVDGQIVNSTTERIAPKPKPESESVPSSIPAQQQAIENSMVALRERLDAMDRKFNSENYYSWEPTLYHSPEEPECRLPILPQVPPMPAYAEMRTCNGCLDPFDDDKFLHCQECDDFDLCIHCFSKEVEGHHPAHTFHPLVPGSVNAVNITSKLAPGRNHFHQAICDNCDRYITGIRYKCLDCPDWDHCDECSSQSSTVHPGHRFVPIYDHVPAATTKASNYHVGVMCDGSLCARGKSSYTTYIHGVRYKCAVCADYDLCATCEAHPGNDHNPTHPMIKMRTPIRDISVTTYNEQPNGQRSVTLGDRIPSACPASAAHRSPLSMNKPQTVVNTEPQPAAAPVKEKKSQVAEAPKQETPKEAPKEAPKTTVANANMRATFVRDTVADGTVLPTAHEFVQTWCLRNTGETAWPAGCSVKFVGGDYMGCIDTSRPARTEELAEASESNTCNVEIQPGDEYSFTMKLRTPPHPGKAVSYWRPTAPNGTKFGDRLWCDINVRSMEASEPKKEPEQEKEVKQEQPKEEPKEEEPELASSHMIFPKLENESPMASIHEEAQTTSDEHETKSDRSLSQDLEWDGSDEDFLTDEEYDILDASDEEFLEEQRRMNAHY